MTKKFYLLLIVVSILNLILNILRKSTVEIVHTENTIAVTYHFQNISLITYIAFLGLFLVYLFQKKFLFIFVMQLIEAIGLILEGAFHSTAMTGMSGADMTPYHIMVSLNFWITIVLAIAFIWTDKGRNSWLTIYGVLIAVHVSLTSMYFASEGTNLDWLFFISSFLPSLILILYFYIERKKTI